MYFIYARETVHLLPQIVIQELDSFVQLYFVINDIECIRSRMYALLRYFSVGNRLNGFINEFLRGIKH